MSSYLNFAVKTRDQFKTYIFQKLGGPLVRVELHDTHYDNAINDATEEFSKWVTYEQQYVAMNLSAYVQDVGFTMPDNVQSVFSIYDQTMMNGGVSTLFTVPNALWNAGQWPLANNMIGGGSASWIDYEAAMQFVELSRRMVGGGMQFDYNYNTKILNLIPDPSREHVEGFIVIGCNVLRPDDQMYGESWCRRYALACAKETLGRVRSKFTNVQLLGGGGIDISVLAEGLAEKDKLLEELKNEFKPIGFYIG